MKQVEAGEMFGFKVINIFPESSTDEEWQDFAEAITKILSKKEDENKHTA